MSELSDAALVAKTLAGHTGAFSVLVRKYQNYAYATAIGILADFELAQDVAQDALLSAYQDLDQLKDPARFGHWLAGIVRHTALGALRELERLRRLATDMSGQAEAIDPAPLPDQSLEADQQRLAIQQALARLGAKQREVVSLYYLEQRSYSDIASYLGVTEATVQGRLQRARVKLRKEWHMVEEDITDKKLPEDFSARIQRLLDEAEKPSRSWRQQQAVKQLGDMGQSAVEPLCAALEDERKKVREVAALALCAIGDSRALRPILRLLYTQIWQRNTSPLGKLLALDGVRQALLAALRGDSGRPENEKRAALQVLSRARGDEEVFAAAYAIFKNAAAAPALQVCALKALFKIRPEGIPDLVAEAMDRAMDQAQPHLLDPALTQAGKCAEPPSLARCRKAFGQAVHWRDRRRAALLLAAHGPEGKEALENLARTHTAAQRLTALAVLAESGSSQAFDQLLGELLDPQSAGGLDETWQQAYQRLPARADFQKLFWQHPGTASLRADELFHGGSPALRVAAIRAISSQKAATFLPQLRHCLAGGPGRHPKVATEAFRQVLRLGEEALPTVQQMFDSEDWLERKAAVCLLRRWGKLTPQQKKQAAEDHHIAVRQAIHFKRPAPPSKPG